MGPKCVVPPSLFTVINYFPIQEIPMLKKIVQEDHRGAYSPTPWPIA